MEGEVLSTGLAGKSRYETSTLIAETYFDSVSAVVLAYGKNFPDGLSGGALAYSVRAPLILTAPGSEATANLWVADREIGTAYVMGGTGALSDETVETVFER